MNLDSPDFGNEYVRLDIVTAEDRDFVAHEDAIQSMWTWLPVIGPGTSYDAYFNKVIADSKTGKFIPFKVTRKSDNAFAGLVAYDAISRKNRRLQIGFSWHPEAMRGTVIGPATQLALLTRAYTARYRRIEYHAPEHNTRAIAAFQRLGARQEGVLRNFFRLSGGGWSSVAVLSLIDDEIVAAQQLLLERIREVQAA